MIYTLIIGGVGALLLLGLGAATGLDVAPKRRTIIGRNRADGVCAQLQLFLGDCEENAPFDLLIGSDGGLRTDEAKQLSYFLAGTSKAKTLGETPHGRGGALDLYPVVNGVARGLTEADAAKPEVIALFEQLGAFVRSRGLVWGGDFKTFKDRPHVEVPGWRNLPMPSPRVA